MRIVPSSGKLGVHAAIAYRATGRSLIRRWKFEARRDALDALVALAAPRVADLDVGAVVAVSRHPARIRKTGVDPTFVLGRALARAAGLPFLSRALVRTRSTEPQTGKTEAQRRANLAGSFAFFPRSAERRRLLVVDDVVTTGTTLREAMNTVRASGCPDAVPFAFAATESGHEPPRGDLC